uniref:Menorin-like domain-containing protein n=2 Tax=Graphocephala atropunctata TaxID=36148 RepID=A0A1B6KMI5_9HEMI
MSNAPLEVWRYFHEVDHDLTKITWFHACNSRSLLDQALASDVMMIEADIVAGHLAGAGGGPPLAVMGHPPTTVSDLSLEQFLDTVLQRHRAKGIKLDFKTTAAFRASENILEQFLARAEVNFPVWVNADILRGPGIGPGKEVVEPHYFLRTCVTKFPLATISPGWAVNPNASQTLSYSSMNIDEMTSLLLDSHVVFPVTFPVHAGIAANSLDTLTNLVHSSTDGTSLTLWAGQGQHIDYDKLRQLINNLGKDKVFVDLPQDMSEKLWNPHQESKANFAVASSALTLLSFLFVL